MNTDRPVISPRRNEPVIGPGGAPTTRFAEYLENNAARNDFTDDEKTKLDGIEDNATADQTDAEIEPAYNNQVAIVSQVEAEAGSITDVRRWTPERVRQAINALAGVDESFAYFLGV